MITNKFSKGNPVVTANSPYWMTITEVRNFGWYSCRFGSNGGDAGSFHESALVAYKGAV